MADMKIAIGLLLAAVIVVSLGVVSLQSAGSNIESIDLDSDSTNETFLVEQLKTISPSGIGISSFTAQSYNTTWINCTTDDFLNVTLNYSKATISVWFANETTDWTSFIKSGNDYYIDGSLDATWTFEPYYIDGDDLIFCKSDASTFLNVSVDAIRVYEQALNSTQVSEVYGYGR